MSDRDEKLVRMANQIADFFRPYPKEEAIAGVQEHIRSFWSRRMREGLAEHIAAGGAGLRPVVLAAFGREAHAESPTEKAMAGPEEVGQLASDAG